MKVKLDELKQITTKAILKLGYTTEEAKAIVDVLLYAQTRANNQGIVKLIGGGMPKSSGGKMETIKETGVSALIDAHQQQAMIVITKAADIAATKAKEQGIAVIGVNGANSSSGAIGYYARRIADHGLVGLVFTSAGLETVAAEGSFEAIYGTNPLAIAVPSDNGPIVLDMATAAMAYFGVVEANTAGTQLPKDIAYDKEGSLTTSPAKVLDGGALRPFDKGRKGSHLSMMVQLLAGPLVGAAFMGEGDVVNNWAGHLIIAIDPDILGGAEHLRTNATKMISKVKATKKLPGVDEIITAGEHGDRIAKQAEESGEVEIEDNLWNGVKEVAKG